MLHCRVPWFSLLYKPTQRLTHVLQGEEGIKGEKGMRGLRGQEVIYHVTTEPHFDGIVALHPKQ